MVLMAGYLIEFLFMDEYEVPDLLTPVIMLFCGA